MTRRHDDGFTLVELLLTVAITGIIASAVSAAFIGFFRTGTSTSARDDHSAGGALLASYLDRDLASADTYSTTGSGCAVANAAPGTQVRMSWTEARPNPDPTVLTTVAGPVYSVTYAMVLESPATPATSTRALVRRACSPSSTGQTVLLTALLPSTAITSTQSGACSSATSQRVVISLPSYGDDGTPGYSYGGCVRGRIG